MVYQKINSHDEYLKMVEKYSDYEAGTYQYMTLREKMNFLDGVHTDNIPLFDEDGDDMDTSDDYYAIRDEILNHPEQFSLNDILVFFEMLDDSCYQPSFMDNITAIIHNIARYYQLEGVKFLLAHLSEVPRRGYMFGLFVNVQLLIKDDVTYQLMKEAVKLAAPDTIMLLRKILSGEDMPGILEKDGNVNKFPIFAESADETELKRKQELENIILSL